MPLDPSDTETASAEAMQLTVGLRLLQSARLTRVTHWLTLWPQARLSNLGVSCGD